MRRLSEFPDRLRQLRERRRISRRLLSERCGLDTKNVSRYERGEMQPTGATLEKLADFFEVSMDYLWGRDEKKF